MATPSWQLTTPIQAVIFDCDGTLSTIEGIDELANKNGAGDIVQRLTADAMGKSGLNSEIYRKRLDLVRPTSDDIQTLGRQYYETRVHDVPNVIKLLTRMNKSIYILSAGLLPAVKYFGEQIHVPSENIFAVDVEFDSQGRYKTFDLGSPLVNSTGKREFVATLKKKHSDIVYVGDGLNDVAVMDLVKRFVGFGGAYFRENIAALCEFYIKSLAMAPLLPLVLTEAEKLKLPAEGQILYDQGVQSLENGEVIVQSDLHLKENRVN